MSRFHFTRQPNLPPGCTDPDGGASDIYVCERCGRVCSPEELDEEREGFEHVCLACTKGKDVE